MRKIELDEPFVQFILHTYNVLAERGAFKISEYSEIAATVKILEDAINNTVPPETNVERTSPNKPSSGRTK